MGDHRPPQTPTRIRGIGQKSSPGQQQPNKPRERLFESPLTSELNGREQPKQPQIEREATILRSTRRKSIIPVSAKARPNQLSCQPRLVAFPRFRFRRHFPSAPLESRNKVDVPVVPRLFSQHSVYAISQTRVEIFANQSATDSTAQRHCTQVPVFRNVRRTLRK